MAVTASDFLDTAKQFAESKTEIGFRNCISRAYYGSYHKVLCTITHPVPKYATGGVHHRLVQHLQAKSNCEPFDTIEMRKLSYKLKLGHENRCLVDYELSEVFIDEVFAQQVLKQAEAIFSICDNMSQNLNHSRVAP
ncbi:hypothetical protein G3444_11920 [Shewanella baltica]|uniref:hypothetical protein n=1 Tax=Shewanella baltica TaxID=62322 RepID=UPI00217CD4D1|nr:hypothetical protein [Shewanella baltica]MCS6119613.1 hypothetical protein [Shewanella baltica]